MGRPAPWLLMLDLAVLRDRVDVSFRYVEVEDEEAAGGKIAHDVGGAYFVALKDAGLDWVQLPDAYRKKFRHFGGLSWRSARDSQVSARARPADRDDLAGSHALVKGAAAAMGRRRPRPRPRGAQRQPAIVCS